MKYIDELPIAEKRVFIRVDFNVPISEGKIQDASRITAAIPTIKYALSQKAKVILASHLGRPAGEKNQKYSLKPVAEKLAEILSDLEVIMPEDCVGDGIKKLTFEMAPNQIMLLENLRFHKEEEQNEEGFSKKLSELADVYVNDAFGTAHRAHASTSGMVRHFAVKGAGLLMKAELHYLTKILSQPEKPFVAILGGAKVSDKLAIVENLVSRVDKIVIGGAMAYTFLKAQGIEVGSSPVEEEKIHSAKKVLERTKIRAIPFLLPLDHVIAESKDKDAEHRITEGASIPQGYIGLDIGPQTISSFTKAISDAKTIFWNGPMGLFEIQKYSTGTISIAKVIAEGSAVSVVGGGDSVSAVHMAFVSSKITHISTGGGATLEFIEGRELPGIKALET